MGITTLYVHDIEGVAGEHLDVRTGNVVAFGAPATDTEALAVVVESRRPEDTARIAREMRERYLAGRLSARRSRIETGAVILRSWLGHLGPRRSDSPRPMAPPGLC